VGSKSDIFIVFSFLSFFFVCKANSQLHNERALVEVVIEARQMLARCYRIIASEMEFHVASQLQQSKDLTVPVFGFGMHTNISRREKG
jgi:hypothetical protein